MKPEQSYNDVDQSNPRVCFDIDPRIFWSNQQTPKEQNCDISSDDEEHKDFTVKKNKRLSVGEKHEKFRLEEETIRSMEEELEKSTFEPKSAQDCERLLLARPHNTDVWIAYMSLHLQATEIEKARIVAKRALDSFSFMEDKKLEIWFALLNMESKFGDLESLEETFAGALQKNDSITVCKMMIDILVSEKKNDLTKLINFLSKNKLKNPKIFKLLVKTCDEYHLTTEEKSLLQTHLNTV